MRPKEFLIIGGGACGMATALLLDQRGVRATLIEKQDRIGKKILVSGNGRCNISNAHVGPNRFFSHNPAFASLLLKGCPTTQVHRFLETLGVVLVEGEEHRLFPASLSAKSVVMLFEAQLEALGVEMAIGCAATSVTKTPKGFKVSTTKGEMIAKRVLLAAGSPAAPKLGGGEDALGLAANLGHSIIKPVPALVQLLSNASWIRRCKGVKIKGKATLLVDGGEVLTKHGDILFTDYGLSGLAILDISTQTALALKNNKRCEVVLDLSPSTPKQALIAQLKNRIDTRRNLPLTIWLSALYPPKLAATLLGLAKLEAAHESQLNAKTLRSLAFAIKQTKVKIIGTKGFAFAEAASGGVDTTQIDPQTLESKIIKGLYIGGEVLDIVGDRGGFNFHAAWVCALKIAKAYRGA